MAVVPPRRAPSRLLADSSASPFHRRYPLPLDAARAATVVAAAPEPSAPRSVRLARKAADALAAAGANLALVGAARATTAASASAASPSSPSSAPPPSRRQRLQGRRRRDSPALRLHGFKNYQKNLTTAGRRIEERRGSPPCPRTCERSEADSREMETTRADDARAETNRVKEKLAGEPRAESPLDDDSFGLKIPSVSARRR